MNISGGLPWTSGCCAIHASRCRCMVELRRKFSARGMMKSVVVVEHRYRGQGQEDGQSYSSPPEKAKPPGTIRFLTTTARPS